MNHSDFMKTLGMVDIISECHKTLRKQTMEKIHARFELRFSDTDTYLLSLIQHQPISTSDAARFMNVSRQAVHKQVKQLIALGLIKSSEENNNKRNKLLTLTTTGKEICTQITEIKAQFDEQLKQQLGLERYTLLAELLMDKALLKIEK